MPEVRSWFFVSFVVVVTLVSVVAPTSSANVKIGTKTYVFFFNARKKYIFRNLNIILSRNQDIFLTTTHRITGAFDKIPLKHGSIVEENNPAFFRQNKTFLFQFK